MDDDTLALIDRALAEDVGDGDATAEATVDPGARARAKITQKAPGVISGVDVAEAVFRRLDPHVRTERLGPEGEWREGGPVLAVAGSARALLTAERTALNFLGRLSGVATAAARVVRAVEAAGGTAKILDTRKTTPGWRLLEKYAVRCGGGVNHRMALGDAALVKDNHVAAAGGIRAAVDAVRRHAPEIPLEVECDTLEQVREAIEAGVQLVLLDNFSQQDTRTAVALARPAGVRLEASGGLSLDRAHEVAATGVDYLAVGALTHSAPVLDLGFDLRDV
jgi:nicotinate-nucleotide pyrophosphorylase (carboxylating)